MPNPILVPVQPVEEMCPYCRDTEDDLKGSDWALDPHISWCDCSCHERWDREHGTVTGR